MNKAKVGNLAAGSGAKIRLTYVTELKVEGKEIRFYLPTTIAPRYIPPTDKSSTAADLASIKYSTLVFMFLSIRIDKDCNLIIVTQ